MGFEEAETRKGLDLVDVLVESGSRLDPWPHRGVVMPGPAVGVPEGGPHWDPYLHHGECLARSESLRSFAPTFRVSLDALIMRPLMQNPLSEIAADIE